MHELIGQCPPLDVNSLYCNLLQCTDFAGTCVLAEREGKPVGWISGYQPPNEPHVLFVWQVAVAPSARGEGLALSMLQEIVARPECAGVTHVKTTITQENEPSWRLFKALAARKRAPIEGAPHFFRSTHFAGAHATEHLVTIGPFGAAAER